MGKGDLLDYGMDTHGPSEPIRDKQQVSVTGIRCESVFSSPK